MIRSFQDKQPEIAASTFVDETAVVIGDVSIGEHCSIWPNTVIRGDVNRIVIGNYSNIQDNSVCHVNHDAAHNPGGDPLSVGDYVTVGHRALLHACTIHDECMIGMGAIVMDKAVIEPFVVVGAGSMVTIGKVLKSGYLYHGSPAKQVRALTEEEKAYLKYSAEHYARLKDLY